MAQSHTPCNSCVRFVAGVAVGSRNTRFQVAGWALPGSDLHRLIAPASWRTFVPPKRSPSKRQDGGVMMLQHHEVTSETLWCIQDIDFAIKKGVFRFAVLPFARTARCRRYAHRRWFEPALALFRRSNL